MIGLVSFERAYNSGDERLPLHMLGLQPTLQSCWGPEGSIFRRSLRRPDGSHSAGLVTISWNNVSRPLDFAIRQ